MKWFSKISVGTKMIGGLALTVATGSIIAVFGYVGLQRMEEGKNEIVLNSLALRNHMESDMMHDALRADVLAALIASANNDADAMKTAVDDLGQHASLFRKCIAENDSLPLSGDIKKAIADVKPLLASYIAEAEKIIDEAKSNRQAAMARLPEFFESFSALEGKMSNLSDLVEQNTAQAQAAAVESSDSSKFSIVVVALLGTLISILVARMILRSFIGPVRELGSLTAAVAQGDLTVTSSYVSSDELGKLSSSFNDMVRKLGDALARVNDSANAVASATMEISSSSEEMAAGARQQTAQTNEVAAAIEEMTSTILENSKNANDVAATAKKAKDSAIHGGNVVAETVEGMRRIATVVNESAGTVQSLGRSSENIGAIVSAINDIADQTNLLALNAAIEAARAGEQGRGFAVVADEVRRLAERTTKATKEIAEMIKEIQHDTNGAVASIQQGTKQVDEGIKLADRAGDSLKEIVSVSQRLTEMVEQIAAASAQQTTTSEQIAKNVDAINSVTRESSEGTQQIALTADDLNRLTEGLRNLLSGFKFKQDIAAFGQAKVSQKPPARNGRAMKASKHIASEMAVAN